ncbi:hypothetical protein INT48_008432 [Thamnidium elegans]|uniref:PH domain-containing protein n=1 Tax=Thamnidium elegans TaxID=101142 RepID=A0A8H7SQX3_9FUNG|nr:hypothetical protein INT48_008432 [Thamnidium elegans]
MTSTIRQQNNDQNKILPLHEKTEQPPPPPPPHPLHQADLITPPMSPINNSISSSGPITARNSLKITAGQTGLPWLTRDAEGDTYSTINQSPENMTFSSLNNTAPPPKFLARPKTTSIIRFPTRKRTMQKYIYSMKDGLDPVKVLCDRLTSWQISVKYLNSMFQNIKKVEFSTGKGYRKIDSKFMIPSKIENQFKSSGGVKDAWSAFRQYTRENSLIHQDFVDFIENEIIPTLHIMLKDIHQHMDSLKKNKELRTNTLWDCRKKSDSVITRLNSIIYATVNNQEKAKSQYVIPKSDPLLTKYVVTNTIQDLYKQENRLHKEYLETQDKYRQFEQVKIINVYTEMFQTFEDYRIRHHLENLEGVSKVANIFNAIETDGEWLDFLHHRENDLVKQTAAFKDEQTFEFPNISHPLVQPIIMSPLQRHHGKKWTEEYYVLSPVGLLHRFKSENDLHHNPLKPELTLFIPDCSFLLNSSRHLIELRGKTSNSFFGGKKLFELSSDQPDVLQQWIDILGPMAVQKETPVNTMRSVPPHTTTDTHSVHSKVLATEDDYQQQESTAAGADAEQQQQTDIPMQPIVEETKPSTQITPITNTASHFDDEDDEDDDFKRQTIEYSTHSPSSEYPPATTAADSNNPFSLMSGKTHHGSFTNIENGNGGVTDYNATTIQPPGPIREGSDWFYDTATTTTNVDR